MTQPDRTDDAIRAFLAASWERQVFTRDAAATAAAIDARSREGSHARAGRLRTVGILVALGLLVAAMLAVLVGPGSRRSVTPPISQTSVTPSSTARPSASADPDRFTTHTTMGDIAWSRAKVDRGLYVNGQVDGRFVGETDDGAWYASSDGLSWARTAPPTWPLDSAFEADGEVLVVDSPDGGGTMMGPISHRQVLRKDWVDNPGDPGILHLVGDAWVPIAAPAVTPVAPAGTVLRGTAYEHATTLDATHWLVPTVSFIDIPWDSVMSTYLGTPAPSAGDKPTTLWPIWTEADARLRLGQPGADGRFTMRVELVAGDPPVIEFRDDATGKLVHSVQAALPGWTPDAVYRALRYWGLEDRAFVVGHDGEVSLVRPPFAMGEEWVAVTTAFGRYYATSLEPGDDFTVRAVHVWESPDGLTWRPVDIPAVPSEALHYATLTGRPDALLLGIDAEDGTAWTWASGDGSSWTAADRPEAGRHEVIDTDLGWLSNDAFGESAVSRDGVHWEVIDRPPVAEPGFSYVAGHLFLRSGDVLWVGRIVPDA